MQTSRNYRAGQGTCARSDCRFSHDLVDPKKAFNITINPAVLAIPEGHDRDYDGLNELEEYNRSVKAASKTVQEITTHKDPFDFDDIQDRHFGGLMNSSEDY